MKPPSSHLLDYFIDYADENGLSTEQAARHVADYAQQRVPEYRIEQQTSLAKNKIGNEIAKSPKELLVARILIKTMIHSITWEYYPKYHVIGQPRETNIYSIRYTMPVWRPFSDKKTHYIDELFYDREHERFWMPEPYLCETPDAEALFKHITSKDSKALADTSFRKLDPHIITAFLCKAQSRKVYTLRDCDWSKITRRPAYGSKGWKDRIKIVNRYFRLKK